MYRFINEIFYNISVILNAPTKIGTAMRMQRTQVCNETAQRNECGLQRQYKTAGIQRRC